MQNLLLFTLSITLLTGVFVGDVAHAAPSAAQIAQLRTQFQSYRDAVSQVRQYERAMRFAANNPTERSRLSGLLNTAQSAKNTVRTASHNTLDTTLGNLKRLDVTIGTSLQAATTAPAQKAEGPAAGRPFKYLPDGI